MLDTSSRSIIVDRVMADRQAEARRARLISQARRQEAGYEAKVTRPAAAPSLLGRLTQSVRRAVRSSLGAAGAHHPATLG